MQGKQYKDKEFSNVYMNGEANAAITKLLKQYSDIFRIGGNLSTFANKRKHNKRTSHEIPVYTKSYRYPETHRKVVKS